MADQRNISIEIPKLLLDQIDQRSVINDRSRNAEVRYLLQMGLELAGEEEVSIKLPVDNWVKSTVRIEYAQEAMLRSRCQLHQRPLYKELVRIVAHAIQVRTDRDLKLIAEMMQRQDRAAAGTPPPEQPSPRPAELA